MSRFRLDPTPAQESALISHCAHARFVWNLAVEQHSWWRPGRRSAPRYVAQARQLTEARAEFAWLAAGSHMVQQQALRDFALAMKHYFEGKHGSPTWRRAGHDEGFRIVGPEARKVRRCSRKVGEVFVPKAGWVRFRWSRSVPEAKSYRVTKDRAGRWHIAFAVIPEPIPAPDNAAAVGVDRGVVVSAALSSGELLTAPGLSPKQADRLIRLQRKLSHTKRGSRRGERIKSEIARLHARQADRRKDWVEKTTTRLARDFDLIAIEDLKIKAMTATARGTVGCPARNVKAKATLNRGIMASGWGLLAQRLEDKAPGRVVKVDPAYTSQRCNACGTVDRNSRESQARFRCTACGHTAHADVNAARNIRDGAALKLHPADGRAVAARGGAPEGQPVNREPQLVLTP